MKSSLRRCFAVVALAVPLAGCNEFSLNCATPKGNYLLIVKQGVPWVPLLGPAMRWVTPTEVYELNVIRSDEYQVRGELRDRIPGWPPETERQTFVVNRITSEFQTAFQRGSTNVASRAEPASSVIEAINGTCSRTFPQRL
jgi:hypothetical protein